MSDEYHEIAYWMVVKNLDAPVDIPIARLLDALPKFLARSTGSPKKACAVMFDCLSEFAWVWPEWDAYAHKMGYTTLEAIALTVSNMPDHDVLMSLPVSDLKEMCAVWRIEQPARAKKADLVYALLNGVDDSQRSDMILPFRHRLQAAENEKCRKEMALDMVSRILSIAYSLHRYEQLNNPDLLMLCPYWKFVSNGTMLKPCHTQWDGLVLRYDDHWWKTHFPPIDFGCRCRITAVSAREYDGQVAPIE